MNHRLGPAAWHPALVLATWFGAGLWPGMPGSWGSLAVMLDDLLAALYAVLVLSALLANGGVFGVRR